MKAKDQVTFYDAISVMEVDSLEKIREILLKKKTTDDSRAKLAQVEVVIEEKKENENRSPAKIF